MLDAVEAVVAGHICLDIYPSFDHLQPGKFFEILQPGRLIEVGKAVFSTGGPVSNTGLALHKLGVTTRLIGKIGRDLFGGAVLDIIRSYSEELTGTMQLDESSSTAYTFIISPPGVDRMFMHSPGANDTFCSKDIPYNLLAGAKLFHFGYPPVMQRIFENGGAELTSIFKQAKETGVTTSLDICFPDPGSPGGKANWPAIYRDSLRYVDIFLPNIEELMFTLQPEQYKKTGEKAAGNGFLSMVEPGLLEDISAELLDMGVKIAGIKLGSKGFYLRTASLASLEQFGRAAPANLESWADQRLWAPCFKVNVAGTTGAGDATNAGFLTALLREMTPGEAITMGVAVGACNVEAVDSLSGICGWEAAVNRVSSGWERHDMTLKANGWRKDNASQFWIGE